MMGPQQARARLDAAAEGSAAARYRALEAGRRPYLERAREAARLSIPSLLPSESATAATDLPTPYQGVGARGVNNLANKLLLAQFPPNTPFFRLSVDEKLRAEATAGDSAGEQATAKLETGLRRIERDVMREIETGFFRAGLHAALKQLVVAGNVLLHAPPEGGVRVFRLDRYVTRRDPMGALLELIVKESAPADSLPEPARAAALRRSAGSAAGPNDANVELYTWLRREGRGWRVHQEVGDEVIEPSVGGYAEGGLDWMALRWSHVDGEDYGRGHVEEFLGDLKSLEGLMQSIVEGAAAASKMTVLVSPNGQTDAEALAEAENGAILDGEAKDVAILQTGKMNDFRVALESVRMLTERLSFAFLLNSAVQGQGQRATAEEVRFVAGELEDALGGVYSVLAEELQKPLVEALLSHKAQSRRAPALPKGVIKPLIITGLDALGRGHDLQKLQNFLGFAGQIGAMAGSPAGQLLDLPAILGRAAAAIGVEPDAVLRAPSSGADAADQTRLSELLTRLGPDVAAALAQAGPAER